MLISPLFFQDKRIGKKKKTSVKSCFFIYLFHLFIIYMKNSSNYIRVIWICCVCRAYAETGTGNANFPFLFFRARESARKRRRVSSLAT